ncbi:MAG TPA: tetratricopeptide repeat protein [Anaerolineales bacterium]|nr:tetratricopeptide repeat protein [Anaerolineales bacterium]
MAQDEKISFGRLLKRYRRSARLTQETLAERVGYSPNYISMLERGVRSPAPATVDAFAQALGLTSADRTALDAAARGGSIQASVESHLPVPHSRLIGREQDAAMIISLLRQPDVRLMTLIGPGGVGKTRLAEQIAATLSDNFPDGMLFVDLSPVNDPERVPSAIAQALELREASGELIQDRLLGYLRKKELLLLLDTLERVLDAASFISDLLTQCPHIKVLATSRAPLRLREEQQFQVQPLTFPASSSLLSNDDLLQFSAVALFVQRTRLVKPDFKNDNDSLRIIADICRRLDGLPLAIELAAARVKHLPLSELRDQSVHRLEILTGGPRDVPERQQRMSDTIAWSYQLLEPAEQRIFWQLSVFVGSWSLQAAQFMCSAEVGNANLLDTLRVLVDNSLVTLSEARYRMLDTIREFAQEQLALSDEAQAIHQRHADYYLHFAKQAAPALEGGQLSEWHQRLELEEENLRAALHWLMENDETELALRLAGSIWRYWQRQGNLGEGRRWLEEGLAKGKDVSKEVRANALWGAIWLTYHQGDYVRANEESAEYLPLARAINDPLSVRNALTGLGVTAVALGQYEEGVACLRESLAICRGVGKNWHLGTSLLNLGQTLIHLGDPREAVLLLEEALAVYRELGNKAFVARTEGYLGYAALLRRDYELAENYFRQSLREFFELHETMGIAEGLEGLAAVFAATDHPDRTARLAAAAGVIRETIAARPLPLDQATFQTYVQQARKEIDPEAWRIAWDEGSRMSTEEVVARALG